MNLPLIKTENGKTAVQASNLYNALGLTDSQFQRWAKKNILNNLFAIANEDYIMYSEKEILRLDVETISEKPSKRTKNTDFVLTLDFAKKLAMLAQTEKGEEIRNYFLACEKAVQENRTALDNEMFTELNTFREIEKFKTIRNEANKNLRIAREKLVFTQEKVRNLTYKQLTLF